jgi:hypothetical protein
MEFKGLKGPYILVAGAALIADLLLFVILYCCGVAPWLCILIAFGWGIGAVLTGTRLSQRFGAHGWMKHLAAKSLPEIIRAGGRRVYLNLLTK